MLKLHKFKFLKTQFIEPDGTVHILKQECQLLDLMAQVAVNKLEGCKWCMMDGTLISTIQKTGEFETACKQELSNQLGQDIDFELVKIIRQVQKGVNSSIYTDFLKKMRKLKII